MLRTTLPVLLASAAVLALASTATSAVPVEASEEPALLSQALEAGDECAVGDDAERGACSLNALQLRKARSEQQAAASASAFEEAPAYQGLWAMEGPCPGETPHELLFVVKPRGLEEAERTALDRSDPASPRFRQWLSRAEVMQLLRNEAGVQAVRETLGGHASVSILEESAGGEFLRAKAPVATWEELLGARFNMHRHRESGKVLARAAAYSLPQGLQGHVAGVLGAVELGEPLLPPTAPKRRAPEGLLEAAMPRSNTQASCSPEARLVECDTFDELKAVKGPVVSPPTLRQAYNMPPVAATGSAAAIARQRTSQLVYASLNQQWSPSDRLQFQRAFGLPENSVNELDMGNSMASDEGCARQPDDCAESNLDVQYMMAMSPWSQMGYYYMSAESSFYEFLESFARDVASMDHPPHVISISYGLPEAGASRTAVQLFNQLALGMALQGVSILVASGDDGAAGSAVRSTQHGRCAVTRVLGLMACWPASSPWVTAVGATLGIGSGNPEVACSVNATGPAAEATRQFPPLITSGGGYSNIMARPSWQDGHHSRPGRGVPDVSLSGHMYAIVIGGKWLTVDGTSASSPALAGMISLINSQRLEAGQPQVGFLNPLLYRHPEIFHDITVGDNRCASSGAPCCGGYDAEPGWDAVTGLGSVDFEKLLGVLASETANISDYNGTNYTDGGSPGGAPGSPGKGGPPGAPSSPGKGGPPGAPGSPGKGGPPGKGGSPGEPGSPGKGGSPGGSKGGAPGSPGKGGPPSSPGKGGQPGGSKGGAPGDSKGGATVSPGKGGEPGKGGQAGDSESDD